MFVMLIVTFIGLEVTGIKQHSERYVTFEECDRAIISVAHQQKPETGTGMAFRCVREEGA